LCQVARALSAMTARPHPPDRHFHLYPERPFIAPAINDKNKRFPRPGVTAPPAARAAPEPRGVRRRSSPSAGFAGKSDGDKARRARRPSPIAGKSDGAKSFGKKALFGRGQTLRRQSRRSSAAPAIMAMRRVRRASAAMMRRVAIVPSRSGDGEKRSFKAALKDRGGDKRPYNAAARRSAELQPRRPAAAP